MSFDHKWTFNGTFGEVWIDSEYIAEAESVKAEVSINYADIRKPRDLATYKKQLSMEGSGSMTLYKINSRQLMRAYSTEKFGHQVESQLIIKLSDPDAIGMERVVLKNVNFENVPLTEFERASETKQEISFTFAKWEPLDVVEEDTVVYN